MIKLRDCWAYYDPEGTYFISIEELIPFLTRLGDPLGFDEI